MPPHRPSRRFTALATASALALGCVGPAWAAPPPIAPRSVTPPGRVGRLARVTGTVSFHVADAEQWSPATLNYPVTSGNAFWTEPGARADIQLAADRIVLAPATEIDVVTLDDHALSASEPQGEAYLRLRDVTANDTVAVQTPRGTVQITAPGRYGVVAGDADHPTTVTVVDGAVQITGPNLSLQVGPRQTATITGSDTLQGTVGPIAQDAFLTAILAEERPAPRASTAIPAILQRMTGCEDVQDSGTWQDTPQYGAVWYPPVESGWVPYRHGRWSYVAPWGWTWVDEASWGFAPFHYGRWAQIDDRWGWVPVGPGAVGEPVAEYAVPAYAPALVSFVELGGAALAGGAVGYGIGRSVGWVPLGPREAYYPPYSRDLGYVRRLNVSNVQNVTQTITNVSVVNHPVVALVNGRGATVVPAAAMAASAAIAAAARPVSPEQLARAQGRFRAPVVPTAATVGVTPAVARQFNFVPPARPAQPVAGPAIQPALFRAGPGGRPALPPLHTAAAPPVAASPSGTAPPRPAEIARPPAPLGPTEPPRPQPATPGGGAGPRPPVVPQRAEPPRPTIAPRPLPPVVRQPPPAPRAPAPPAPVFRPAPVRPPQPAFRPAPPAPAFRPPPPRAVAPPAPRPAPPPARPAPPPRPAPPHRP